MKYWKEKYTEKAALECGIHGYEGSSVIGKRDAEWIYFVEVKGFRFAFFSIEMLDRYIDFFSRKILPSTRHHDSSPFSDGPAACIGGGQSPFERLPVFLRKKNVRPKVLKALTEAREHFTK